MVVPLRAGHVVDAFSTMDLVSCGTVLHFDPVHRQLPCEGYANVCGKSGVLTCRYVPERDESQPVGGCHEHLHARV